MSKRSRKEVLGALYGPQRKRPRSTPESSKTPRVPIVIEDLNLRRKKSKLPTGRTLVPNVVASFNSAVRTDPPPVASSSRLPPLFAHTDTNDEHDPALFEGVVFEQLVEPERQRKTTTSYLTSWIPQRDLFLSEIIEREAPPSTLLCSICPQPLKWRCHDCFGEPVYCTACCNAAHKHSPFHRVSQWNGKTFYRSSLRKTGLILFMGHAGCPCPSIADRVLPSTYTTPSSSTWTTPTASPHESPHPLPSVPLPHLHARSEPDPSTIDRYMAMMDETNTEDAFGPFDFSNFHVPSSPPVPSPLHRASALRPVRTLSSPPMSPMGMEDISREHEHDPVRSLSRGSDVEVDDLLGDDDSDELMEFETAGITPSSLRYPKGRTHQGDPWFTIIDITGVHHLPVHFCDCDQVTPHHIQLLRSGLYPVTYDRPQTVFTFRVLEDFDLENLETKASAQRYYAKLRRLTCNAFPQTVPDRYREMLRIMREWRNLQSRKRAGIFGKDANKEISPGGLALFCPACPQPGINLPPDWKTDEVDDWKYMGTLLGDGNFKQEHLKMKYPEDDVPLSDGHGYMVGKAGFDDYMKVAPMPRSAAPTCHEHDAVRKQNVTRAHLDATGIGAIACGRHSCFVPHSVVNFQKGEGYRYMDYAFANALNYISFLLLFMLMYDIMCQWFPNFLSRLSAVQTLIKLRDGLALKCAIGLFHVHGHIKQCYPRYASTFIRGAGIVDGKIIETLWHILNDTASSARSMSWYHRQEYLDCHMADSNWKKLTRMVPTLLRKWYACGDQVSDSEEYFSQLSLHVGPARVAEWTKDEDRMQSQRDQNVEVMDEFDVEDDKVIFDLLVAPGKATVQRELAENEHDLNIPLGCSAWIALGLKLEEQQLEILNQVRKMDARASYDRQVSLQAKRRRLQTKIDSFVSQSEGFLGECDEVPQTIIDAEWSNEDEVTDDPVDAGVHSTDDIPNCEPVLPELISLPLPSSFPRDHRRGRLREVSLCELRLRQGQANDSLHNLRVAIAHRSFIFRSRIRKNSPTTGYSMRLRSYGDAHAIQMTIDHAAKVYRTTRTAMMLLGADDKILSTYKVLLKEDLASSTAVAEPNARGQSRVKLSWIWQTTSHSNNPEFLTEMLRVNWLRAKSRRDRWKEEKVLLRSELSWTMNYFTHNVNTWIDRSIDATPGIRCYALKQAITWQRFAHLAQKALTAIGTVTAQ
ncbi:hypothetical protein QCA50_016990 [Cerrena zonata]|uniref:CxC2-like cysteine cluster KDZ transposase-associated domain-containing protein n=1 Tax=Cerrena zonata TaxID=2478898 RepID=A0AAW0FM43_9APHY